MATTIQQIESVPDAYPSMPYTDPPIPDGAFIWKRIEGYTAFRYTARNVVWVVEGPGEWRPPLAPATISTVEIWSHRASAWETATLDASPLGGYRLPCSGPYRFTASVGSGTVPESINEAFRRLTAYLLADTGTAGATLEYIALGGTGGLLERTERDAAWMARALQNSGAADLLRPYRKVP